MDKNILQSVDYNFLREDERLGKNIAYLTVSGSISYGTNNADSDLDVRGFAVESLNSILTNKAFEQIADDKTDTVIYGLRKFFKLCAENNPNALELLGTRAEHVLYMNNAGKKFVTTRKFFCQSWLIKNLSALQRLSVVACKML